MLNVGSTELDCDDGHCSSGGSAAVQYGALHNEQSEAVSDRTADCTDCFGGLRATQTNRNNMAQTNYSCTDDAITEKPLAVKRGRFDIDAYASKKSAASGLMDIALLMANASQLKHVLLSHGNGHYFYWPMLVLLLLSIGLQLGIGIALLVLSRTTIYQAEDTDTDEQQLDMIEARNRRAESINNAVLAAILLLTFINTFISAFGLDSTRTK